MGGGDPRGQYQDRVTAQPTAAAYAHCTQCEVIQARASRCAFAI